MTEIILRSGVLILVCLATWLMVWTGRRYVENQRRHALAANVTLPGSLIGAGTPKETSSHPSPVRILAFSSDDCRQCHQLQAPALQRVVETHQNKVTVMEVDAPSEPELTARYHVLTLPTTVVLNSTGRTHAVNYGFVNTKKLLEQVDEVLSQTIS
ncbi:MAG TPA: thioredoxin family protein [Ktedonobacteraceae bacterium]|nr:thioredoxin family protein [Ktedonobacteraceae bacterium]